MVYLCHACGHPGQLVRFDERRRPVYWCRTQDCDVVEYDREVIRLRDGVPMVPSAARRVRTRAMQRSPLLDFA